MQQYPMYNRNLTVEVSNLPPDFDLSVRYCVISLDHSPVLMICKVFIKMKGANAADFL
jgi:hypothetical protein